MHILTRRRSRCLSFGALALGLSLALSAAAPAGSSHGAASTARAAAGQLIVLEDDLAPALDYDGATAAHPLLQEILNNTMEPLLDYPLVKQGDILNINYKVGPFGFEPRLATSWTQKGLVWTFHLRKGVRSCAGNTFTADDVIYTAERAISVSGGAPVGWFLMNVGAVFPLDPVSSKDPNAKKLHGEVVKVDDYTVQFKQLQPNEQFPRVLQIFAWDIWDSKVMKEHATAKDPWSHDYAATANAPGFGAYCVSKWNKGSQMDLTANPNYYRGQPEFKHIIIRKVPANANRVAALKSGDADMVAPLTPQEYANVATDPKVKVLSAYNNKIFALGMNYSFPPFTTANKLVRQAMAYAIPYADIIKQDFYGQAKPWYGLVESNYYGYKKIARYKTDLAKAKALLAKAGFPGGKGLEKYKANLHLYYVAERRSLLEPIANRIKTGLAQIGMQISLNPISQTEYTDRGLTKYDMPMFLRDADWPLGPDAGYAALLFYVSKKNGGLNTPTNYASAKVDALFAKSQASVGAKRLGYLHQLQDVIMEDLPLIPIAEPSSQAAMRKGLTGWAITGENIFQFWYFKSAK